METNYGAWTNWENTVAEMFATNTTWNNKIFCWVNRGAKGIALFDRESECPRLKYVFDVSDMHKARKIGKDPCLWEIREQHKDAVITQLEKTYGATNKNSSFEDRLVEIAGRIAEDNYREFLPDLSYYKHASFYSIYPFILVQCRHRFMERRDTDQATGFGYA